MKILMAIDGRIDHFPSHRPGWEPADDLKAVTNLPGPAKPEARLVVTFHDMLPWAAAVKRGRNQDHAGDQGEFTWRSNRTWPSSPRPASAIPAHIRLHPGRNEVIESALLGSTLALSTLSLSRQFQTAQNISADGGENGCRDWVAAAITLRFDQPVSPPAPIAFRPQRPGGEAATSDRSKASNLEVRFQRTEAGILYRLLIRKDSRQREHRHGQGVLLHLRHGAAVRLRGEPPGHLPIRYLAPFLMPWPMPTPR
jgi:hypothetical protein